MNFSACIFYIDSFTFNFKKFDLSIDFDFNLGLKPAKFIALLITIFIQALAKHLDVQDLHDFEKAIIWQLQEIFHEQEDCQPTDRSHDLMF